MAVSFATLTRDGSDTDARDYTTGTVTPSTPTDDDSVALYAALIVHDLGNQRTAATLTGLGLTWTQINIVGGGATEPYLQVFRATVPGGGVTPGTLAFAGVVQAGQTADGAQWCVVEAVGPNVAATDAVVQNATGSTNTDSVSATLAAFAGSQNVTGAFIAAYDSAAATAVDITEGSGFTMLTGSEGNQAAGGDSLNIGFEFKLANDTGVDATAAAANDRLLIVAFEIAVSTKAAVASGTGTAPSAAASLGTGTGDPGATGAAGGPTSTLLIGVAAGAGTGATESPSAAVATSAAASVGSGTGNGVTANLGTGTGDPGVTGAAGGPQSSIQTSVATATGTGSAFGATISTSVSANAAAAVGTGVADSGTTALETGTGDPGATGASAGPGGQIAVGVAAAAGIGTAYAATTTTSVAAAPGSAIIGFEHAVALLDAGHATAMVGEEPTGSAVLGDPGGSLKGKQRALIGSSPSGSATLG